VILTSSPKYVLEMSSHLHWREAFLYYIWRHSIMMKKKVMTLVLLYERLFQKWELGKNTIVYSLMRKIILGLLFINTYYRKLLSFYFWQLQDIKVESKEKKKILIWKHIQVQTIKSDVENNLAEVTNEICLPFHEFRRNLSKDSILSIWDLWK